MSDAAERIARIRAAVLRMVLGVVVVDAVALTVLFFTDVEQSPTLRWPMLGGWMLATLAVVLPGLREVRLARRS
ncbi:MAG: hypothetical protein SFU84_10665 [Gemmatimonadales bacterium]|nr:hypothetical protein [Gemmatimonadales bacterium]